MSPLRTQKLFWLFRPNPGGSPSSSRHRADGDGGTGGGNRPDEDTLAVVALPDAAVALVGDGVDVRR